MVYHKFLSGTYGDNYRYGMSLYSPSADDVEKKYRSTLSKTHVRSDRGDLGMYTFAGSNVHGGVPPAEKISAPKTSRSTTNDLYAPLNTTQYGRGYYDHLRATTPERRIPSRTTVDPYNVSDEPDFKTRSKVPDFGYGYQTVPTRLSSTDFVHDLDSDRKRTVTKTTTTTEQWVPLTTHIYSSPYHTYYYKSTPFSSYTYRSGDDLYDYNYLDDYKRTTTTTTKRQNIDALDLSVSKSYEKSDYSHYSEKCNEIQRQLDEVNKWIYEAETKLKNDVYNSRNKIQTELADVSLIVDDTLKYNEDLYRAIKKQAKQISTLNSQYDQVNTHLMDVSDVLEKSRLRCQTLQSDLSSVQSSLEMKMKRIY